MSSRSFVSVGLTITLLAATTPVARAEESGPVSSEIDRATSSVPLVTQVTQPPDVLALVRTTRFIDPAIASASGFPFTATNPTDIRLSRGAKTAIIVTAIVVGVLLIAGVIVVARPHKL